MLTREQATVGTRVKIPTQKTVGTPLDASINGLTGYAQHCSIAIVIKWVVPWPVEGKECVMLGLRGNDLKDGGYYALEDLNKF